MTDFLAEMNRQQAQLDREDAAAKAKGQLVGRYVTHSVADGQAVYKIVGVSGAKARIEWVDIGDGYSVVAWGKGASVALKTINALLGQRDALTALFARTDNFWTTQTLGAVVHYDSGFGQYVRGVIITHEGEKKMLPTALVGTGWRAHDLVSRRVDGSVYNGPYVTKIINKEPMQPNASNMVEYAEHRLSGAHPATMIPLDLTPPGLSLEEEELARVENLRKEVLAALNVGGLGIGPAAQKTIIIMKALAAARALLNG